MKYSDSQSIEEHNTILFQNFRGLDIPVDEYIITSGGPLAIRNIKKTADVDVLASEKLWEELATKHQVKKYPERGVSIISLIDDIDVLHFDEQSKDGPTDIEQIKNAEIIDGLPFQSLRDCLWFKKHSDRAKDKQDIELAKEYFKTHTEELQKIDFSL